MIDPGRLFAIDGRVALVTGASSGIGRMIATALAAAGANVFACARGTERLDSAVAEIVAETGGRCVAIPGDVATVDGIKALVRSVAARTDALHILVNNAGTLCDAPIDDYPESGWDAVLDLNLKSGFFLTQQCLPLLRAGAKEDCPASIVNIGSVGGLRVGPRETYAYAAAKAGLHHLTGSLARRLGPEHITVNAIAPGFFPSDMTRMTSDAMHDALIAQVPRRRVGEPKDIGGLTLFLASPASAYLTGAVIPLDGGMSL